MISHILQHEIIIFIQLQLPRSYVFELFFFRKIFTELFSIITTLDFFLCLVVIICASKSQVTMFTTETQVLHIVHRVLFLFLPALKHGKFLEFHC